MGRIAACVVAIGVAVSGVHVANATEPFAKVGIYSGLWLQLPHGVRNLGMGATGTADVSGFATGYFNPAGVASAHATTLIGSYEDLGSADLSLSDYQLSTPAPIHDDSSSGDWRFAGSIAYARLGMEPQTERTIFLPNGTGRTFDASDWMLAALAAAQWNHGHLSLSAGLDAKYLRSNMADASATSWALDGGVIAAFPFHVGGGLLRPRAGYAILNLDTGMSYDGREGSIANLQRGGFGFDLEAPATIVWDRAVPAVSFSLDYDRMDREGTTPYEYGAGFELSIMELIHVRYGVIDSAYTTHGMGVGWDYGHWLFRMDYAQTTREDGFLPDFDNDLDRDAFGALVGVRW